MVEVEDYDPYANRTRVVRVTNSTFEATLYVIGSTVGTCIMAMPFAFKYSGLYFGMVATIVIGLLGTLTSHMLINCSRILCKKERVPAMDYSEISIAAFEHGPERFRQHKHKLRIIVESFTIMNKGGTCCIYILFICYNTMFIVNYYVSQSGWNITLLSSSRIWMLFITFLLIPMNLSHDMKSIAPVSYFATICIATGVILTAYYVVYDPMANDIKFVAGMDRIPLFCGISIFVTNYITSLLPVEENMKHPEKMSGPWFSVINVSSVIVLMFYAASGWCGYKKYGESTRSIVTLNLPQNEIIAQIAMAATVIGTFFAYSIHFYVMFLELWRHVEIYLRVDVRIAGTHWFRVIMVIITMFVAMAVPNVSGFLSVIGSLGLAMLALVIPPFIDSLVHWENEKTTKCIIRTARNVSIMLVGLVIAVLGTSMGIVEIIMNYGADN